MERIGIEQAFAAMYEYRDRYPGCSMFSALPDAPVVEDKTGVLARLVRLLSRARTLAPRPRENGRIVAPECPCPTISPFSRSAVGAERERSAR